MLPCLNRMSTAPTPERIEHLERDNLRLRRAVEELSIINEVASAVTWTWSLDKIIDSIVQKCVKHLDVDQGNISLFAEEEEETALRTMVRRVDSRLDSNPFRIGTQLSGWMLKNQAPLIINDIAADGRFRAISDDDKPIKSLAAVPLRVKGRMIGILSAFNKHSSEGFTESDQRLLTIIAAQSTQVIEHARLYQEEQALQRMQQELDLARNIQNNLLPKSPPNVPGYDVAGQSVSAENVGGDYFDFLVSEEGQLAICLGDVSGKGMPASLLMANVQATIRSQNLAGASAAACIERSNRLLFQSTDSDKFVTLFYGVIETESKQLDYCNAGHNPPILISGDNVERLESGGPVLGILPDFPYEEASVQLRTGDVLLVFSDGFSEAMNHSLEEYGEEKLIELTKQHREKSAVELIDKIAHSVEQHCDDAPQSDDMTIIALRLDG